MPTESHLSETATAPHAETAAEAPATGADWCVVEIFGHRRLAGLVLEEDKAGTRMLRIDVPTVAWREVASEDEAAGRDAVPEIIDWTTQWYGGAAIFSITPTDEATALKFNAPWRPVRPYTAQLTAREDWPEDDSGPADDEPDPEDG